MKMRTSKFLVPVALCVMGGFAFVFTGCEKKEPAPSAPPPHAPESYMNDPQFRGKLAEERKAHVKLVRDANAVAEKMKSKVDALRAKLGEADPAKLKAELEKDPEWNALYAECTNANAKVESHRKEQLGIVRERLTPKKDISK